MQQEVLVQRDELYAAGALPQVLFFRDGAAGPRGRSQATTEDRDDREQEQERALLCRLCGAPITTGKWRFSKNGKHLHTFFNPAGIVYEIGCFGKAPGCLVHGPESSEFSWFAEYLWQVAACATCSKHLGWYFISARDAFFGLIVNRLRAG